MSYSWSRILVAAGLLATSLLAGSQAQAQSLLGNSTAYANPGVPCLFGNCGNASAGSYGPALFAPNRLTPHRPNGCEPYCANNNFPLSDWNYIRKYCGPTLIPGSCYGHFQTKWRKWEDHCPGGSGAPCAPGQGAELLYNPIPTAPAPMYQPAPMLQTPVPMPNTTQPGSELLPKPQPPVGDDKPSLFPSSIPLPKIPAPMPTLDGR